MKDIKFLSSDGDFLFLEDSDGQKYRLVLDDTVRRASRGESAAKLDEPTITPREIQEEIRAGRNIEEIVRSSGASEDYVQKFAQPVLDELDHAVRNALAVRLEIAGDRFNEPTAREFGEIIKTRIIASGAGMETWSAMKAPDHGFYIYCQFELDGETKKAIWSYDPKRLALAPENEIAITLSSQDRLAQQAPKLIPVRSAPSFTENLADTVDLVRFLPTTPQNTQATSTPEKDDQPLSETADLLEALRKKRNEREAVDHLEPHPATEGLRVVEYTPEPISALKPESEQTEPEPNTSEPAPAPDSVSKKGRASIPSWDEIVFGTKTDD
jgi:hypothetical protein